MSKQIIIGLIEDVASRALDRVDGLRIIESYLLARETAHKTSTRNDEGKKASLFANGLLDSVRKAGVVPRLRMLDSMTYYPIVIEGKKYEITDRAEILNELIKELK